MICTYLPGFYITMSEVGVLHYYEGSLLTTVFASVSGLFIAMKIGK